MSKSGGMQKSQRTECVEESPSYGCKREGWTAKKSSEGLTANQLGSEVGCGVFRFELSATKSEHSNQMWVPEPTKHRELAEENLEACGRGRLHELQCNPLIGPSVLCCVGRSSSPLPQPLTQLVAVGKNAPTLGCPRNVAQLCFCAQRRMRQSDTLWNTAGWLASTKRLTSQLAHALLVSRCRWHSQTHCAR